MFWHIFSHRLKCLIRDRQMVFWTFFFPIVLATLFNLAFANLLSSEQFETIKIAVVDNSEYQNDASFKSALDSVSKSQASTDGKALFNVTQASTKERADELLENNKIEGYIVFDGGPRLVVKESGLNQTIIKEFLDNYLQSTATAQTVISQNPAAAAALTADLQNQKSFLKAVPVGKAEPNTILNYYYALIAMACMYGGFWGLKEVTAVQADLSPQGARVNLAPVHKLKVFGYSLCASMVIELISIAFLLLYLSLALKVSFGNQLGYIMLTCFAGCLMGVSWGAMIGAVIKKKEGVKIAVLIAVSMLCSFLSGMMSDQIKYWVAQTLPVLAYINPANLVTDAFYSLYYYDTYSRFFTNIGLLFAFSILCYFIVYFIMRRQKYASL